MIGLCQEGKSSPDALRRSASVNSFGFFAACVGLSAVVPSSIEEPDFHLLAQPVELPRRLNLCTPASLETYQREHRELTLLRPVGLMARPGRQRAEEISFLSSAALTQRCNYLPALPENSVAHDRRPKGRSPVSVPPPALRD